MRARNQLTVIKMERTSANVYASPRVAEALNEVSEELDLYRGVRLGQVLEAVYTQGKKDGARQAFEQVDAGVLEARKAVPHKNPGRPKKRK